VGKEITFSGFYLFYFSLKISAFSSEHLKKVSFLDRVLVSGKMNSTVLNI